MALPERKRSWNYPGGAILFCCVTSLQAQNVAGVIGKAHRAGDFEGVVVINQNGVTRNAIAVGYADRAQKIQLRTDTLFRLASLTKQVTALLIMQEITAGHLRIDDDAHRFLPAMPFVTVKQLLQHVSGLPNPSDGPEDKVPPFYLRQDPESANVTKAALGFCAGTPKRAPGGNFEYNNCDYLVLGAILEKLTGLSYAALVQQRVITPLRLTSWGLFPANPAQAPRVARAYTKDGSEDLWQNPATYGSAGALYGNALDVAKWNNALLTYKLLPQEATATMFAADPNLYGEALGSWAYDLPLTTPALHIVERQGDIGATLLLNLLLPQHSASIVIISNTERADLFNTYSRKGLGFEILKAFVNELK